MKKHDKNNSTNQLLQLTIDKNLISLTFNYIVL